MESTSEGRQEAVREVDARSAADRNEEIFDPTIDAYAQAELTSRAERMERMIEKARATD